LNVVVVGASHKAASASLRMTPHQSSRSRSSKSWSDEPPNESSPQTYVQPTLTNNTSHFDFDMSNVSQMNNNNNKQSTSSSQQLQDKYRCDQMILEHNNGPIDYEQILLPIPTTNKYHTGQFVMF
jgi:hypothetical protein